jgi:hypothetical protein
LSSPHSRAQLARCQLTGSIQKGLREPGLRKHRLPAWQWLVASVPEVGVACTSIGSTPPARCWSIVNRDAAEMSTRLSCQPSFESPRCCAVTFSGFHPVTRWKGSFDFRGSTDRQNQLGSAGSELPGVYCELGSRITHRQNDVESQLSTMVAFSSGKAVIPDNGLLVLFILHDGHYASTWNWRMAMISSSLL